MKQRLALVSTFALALCFAAPAVAQRPTSPTQELGPPPTGGIWVGASGAPYRDPLRMTPFLAEIATFPFTDVIVKVRTNADAYYNSKLVPRAVGVPDQFDPLKTLITNLKGGANPKRVIAWIDPYHAGNLNESASLADHHVLIAHQNWLSLREDRDSADSKGDMFLEPGLPEVQQHLEAVVRDLVKNYDIDGIYFDHVGDPRGDGKWGYHPDIVQRWVQKKGIAGAPAASDPEWHAFRAQILSEALKGLVDAARAEKPDLMIGVGIDAMGAPPAAAEAWRSSGDFKQSRQDFPAWTALPGISRFYIKNFHDEVAEARVFDAWMDLALKLGDQRPAQMVIGVSGELNEALNALKQLRRTAEAGAGGMALWQFSQPVRDAGSRQLFLSAVARTVLSPEFLRSMDTIQRGRTQPINLTMVTKGDAQPPSATPAPTPAPDAGDTEPAGVEARLPLPPPPTMPEVADEPGNDAAPKIEEGEGRVIPVTGGEPAERTRPTQPTAAKGDIDPDTMLALERLTSSRPREAVVPTPAVDDAPTTASTRQMTLTEMLDDFLASPRFQQAIDMHAILRSDTAAEELKKKYGNIF